MLDLQEDDEPAYLEMLAERGTPWGEIPEDQPMARCIEHTITMIIHRMELDSTGTDNLRLSALEAVAWFKSKGMYSFS